MPYYLLSHDIPIPLKLEGNTIDLGIHINKTQNFRL